MTFVFEVFGALNEAGLWDHPLKAGSWKDLNN
jgi:hypothetical protein